MPAPPTLPRLPALGYPSQQALFRPLFGNGPQKNKKNPKPQYHTVVRLGTLAAAKAYNELLAETVADTGLPAKPDIEYALENERNTTWAHVYHARVADALMKDFSALKLHRADDGKILMYYRTWAVWHTTGLLLEKASGSCSGWAYFFADALAVQGIAANPVVIKPKSEVRGKEGFLFVKSWSGPSDKESLKEFSEGDVIDIAKNRYKPYLKKVLEFNRSKSGWVRSQGNTKDTAPAIFTNHWVVEVATGKKENDTDRLVWFDPSYGQRYEPDPADADGPVKSILRQLQYRSFSYVLVPVAGGKLLVRKIDNKFKDIVITYIKTLNPY